MGASSAKAFEAAPPELTPEEAEAAAQAVTPAPKKSQPKLLFRSMYSQDCRAEVYRLTASSVRLHVCVLRAYGGTGAPFMPSDPAGPWAVRFIGPCSVGGSLCVLDLLDDVCFESGSVRATLEEVPRSGVCLAELVQSLDAVCHPFRQSLPPEYFVKPSTKPLARLEYVGHQRLAAEEVGVGVEDYILRNELDDNEAHALLSLSQKEQLEVVALGDLPPGSEKSAVIVRRIWGVRRGEAAGAEVPASENTWEPPWGCCDFKRR
eukprot:NODE_13027_length_1189_cov_12.799435.p1 GENE.NODE_13027_length_1189_cov_12.799435~~NODE_13027_length_1189_cov_12.799435.p1  ORF type:complete len:292 (-),score=82.19 NODE_13027_length_1189_cov_12.799435:313-1101(-)